MRRLFAALSAALTAALVLPGVAAAGVSPVYTRVLHAYQANGRIPPCEFTSQQLQSALGGVDTYGQQYYADFIGAIDAALTARAGGACSEHHNGTAPAGVTAGGGGSGRVPGAPALPSSITTPTTSGLPLPAILLIALGAVLGALAAASRWARARGWEPRSAAGWRHGAGEARYRIEGSWLELRERLRR